jgi:hypothetical protein
MVLQVSFESVKPARPVPTIRLEPVGDFPQRLCPQSVPASLAVAAKRDQSRLPQDLQVLGDSWLAELEVCDELVDGALTLTQQIEDPTPRGIG